MPFGHLMQSLIDVIRALIIPVCRYARNASKIPTTKGMTSIDSSHKQEEHATVVTQMFFVNLGKVAGVSFLFCARHGPNAKRPPAPSDNIVSLAEFMIPKLFVRLFLYFRGWSRRYEELVEQKKPRASEVNKENFSSHLVAQAHLLIEFLQVCEFLFSFLCARSFIICYTTTMNMSTVGGGHYFGIHMVLSISSVALSFVIHT
ncbi:hypothetical protein Tcan_10628 [Toxocara canis]|uniref:Uncharacterized protein n=1 Tax=Toxocara canis TaxID=6265 RepID=A0A0B2V5V9_TOXCA|nr:hypothetical protein Tcan_10628 [Toxocara canis]